MKASLGIQLVEDRAAAWVQRGRSPLKRICELLMVGPKQSTADAAAAAAADDDDDEVLEVPGDKQGPFFPELLAVEQDTQATRTKDLQQRRSTVGPW